MPYYERDILPENRLEALLKPTVGRLYDTKAPGYPINDTIAQRMC